MNRSIPNNSTLSTMPLPTSNWLIKAKIYAPLLRKIHCCRQQFLREINGKCRQLVQPALRAYLALSACIRCIHYCDARISSNLFGQLPATDINSYHMTNILASNTSVKPVLAPISMAWRPAISIIGKAFRPQQVSTLRDAGVTV